LTHLQLWDLGGQSRYRSEWGRYTKGSDVIIFVVDTQAPEDLPTAKKELHQLLEDRELARLPLLILANKIDLGPKISEPEMIKGLNLDYITETNWLIIPGQAGSARRSARRQVLLTLSVARAHSLSFLSVFVLQCVPRKARTSIARPISSSNNRMHEQRRLPLFSALFRPSSSLSSLTVESRRGRLRACSVDLSCARAVTVLRPIA